MTRRHAILTAAPLSRPASPRLTRIFFLLTTALLLPPTPASPQFVEPGPDRAEGDGPFDRTVIRGAIVIDGTGAPPRGPVDIVIEGNRIARIAGVGYPGLEELLSYDVILDPTMTAYLASRDVMRARTAEWPQTARESARRDRRTGFTLPLPLGAPESRDGGEGADWGGPVHDQGRNCV